MATDYLSALNAGSGLNVNQIVDALVDAERVPKQQKIDDAKETATVKISALGSLKNELSVFQTNTAALDGQIGLALSSSTSNVKLSRTDSSLASEFSHTINVSSIAAGQVLNFDNGGSGFSSTTADIGIDNLTIDFGTWGAGPAFTSNGTSSSLSLTTGATALSDVRDAINNAAIGVTASIIEVSTGSYSLMVKSPEGAENAMRITTSLSGAAVGVIKYDPENTGSFADTATEVVSASDAAFTIDGISVTRSSNTITDLFSGITLELDNVSASDMGTNQVISSRYSETDALATLETVVSEINYLLSFLKEQSKPGTNGEDGGPLHGDHFIRYTENKIKNLTSTAIAGYDDEEIYLSSFGVVTELDGTLSIDETRFREYFDSNPEHFAAVTTSMIRTGDAGVTGSAPTDFFTPGVYGFALSGGTATLTDSGGTTENMSAGTNRYGYSSDTIGATGLLLDTSKTSVNTNVYMGRSIMQTLSKYIDDVLMLNGDIDEKIYNLEDDVDSLVEEQEALDQQIASQRAIYVEKFTAMQTAVSSFKKTGEFLDNLIKSWNSSN
ncbi:MAG: flagellar filament capping protein FliD [Proteobacteria bacterium]|nr:flagellar filament capping protein FliD [Pseudomonadota bacterium]MDA0845898.1 flagellar filament capping protein FliD [Pseudomonadota bacterium]